MDVLFTAGEVVHVPITAGDVVIVQVTAGDGVRRAPAELPRRTHAITYDTGT